MKVTGQKNLLKIKYKIINFNKTYKHIMLVDKFL